MKCNKGHKINDTKTKLHDDKSGKEYQIFKCSICDAWFIYIHGKLRNLESMVQNKQIVKNEPAQIERRFPDNE